MKPLLVSIPHSGEKLAEEAFWLKDLPPAVLNEDVDRFVDQLYRPVLDELSVPRVIQAYHRYIVDCNRWPQDVDADSLKGAENPSGTHPIGLHWRQTTKGHPLIKTPLDPALHKQILDKYYYSFFKAIDLLYSKFRSQGAQSIYHLDLHSMPSRGTSMHRDLEQERSDVVICTGPGPLEGKLYTATVSWREKVFAAYHRQGFYVRWNHPYYGGTIVEKYGRPDQGIQAIMVEVNRKLYMDEKTKQWIPEKARSLQKKLRQAIREIYNQIPDIA